MPVHPRGRGESIKIGPKRKIAFVCSGGATKAGAFHLGVALALQEQGFRFFGGTAAQKGARPQPGPMEISTYVGSSAGSIISTYLAAGYSLDNIFDSFLGNTPSAADAANYLPKLLPRLTYQKMFRLKSNLGPRFGPEQLKQLKHVRRIFTDLYEGNWESLLQLKWLKLSGIFSTSGIEQYIREEVVLSNRFHDYLADLFIVATQLNHSRKVVFGKTSYQPPPHDLTCQYNSDVGISEACASSTALPVIYSPYGIRGADGKITYYIDGEIRDTLSSHVAVDSGADLVIASYTHQPYHVRGDLSLTEHGLSAIVIQSIYLLIEQKINIHIHNKQIQRNAIDAVNRYCKTEGLADTQRKKICEILQTELSHRMDVETIYIHPNPHDAHLFFGDHFSLSPKRMTDIARSGFKAAIETLRKYDFADRVKGHAMGQSGNFI